MGEIRYAPSTAARYIIEGVDAGISGNRLLNNAGTAGDSTLARFDRDVIGQAGVRTVVLLEGINDIGGSRGATEPSKMLPAYDVGDHLHPNAEGFKAMAQAYNLKEL